MLDVRTYRGADVYSDHNLVVGNLRMRPAALNTTGNKRRKVYVSLQPSTVQGSASQQFRQCGISLQVVRYCSLMFIEKADKAMNKRQHMVAYRKQTQLHSTQDAVKKSEMGVLYK